jgi:hypothetical protein
MNQYMMKYLVRQRTIQKYSNFSYQKVLVDSKNNRNVKTKIIAWDVYFSGVKLTTLGTLKEVKYYIETKNGVV